MSIERSRRPRTLPHRLLAVGLLVGLFAFEGAGRAPRTTFAGEPDARTRAEQDLNHERRAAIERACKYIASSKNRNRDSSFGDDKAIVAFTALSALALMSDGSGVNRGPYGQEVAGAVKFLVGLVKSPARRDARVPEGFFFFTGDNNSKMHGQGYATLCLGSALGTAEADVAADIRQVLRKAVVCCEKSQTGTGGWGYDPDPGGEHEGSVTVTVAQGLRAARDAGILVDANVVKMGIRYLERSQKWKPGEKDDGSFKYSLSTDRSTYALTAAALSSFFLFGKYMEEEELTHPIERGIAYLQRELDGELKGREWFPYGNFYAAWAAWQKDGDKADPLSGGFWGPWHTAIYRKILGSQRTDGSWVDPYDRFQFGPLLATAFSVLTLAIPDEQLPIFQR